MNSKAPLLVAIYGIVLIILTSTAHWAASEGVPTSFITGLAGGALCLFLGAVGMIGWRFRAWTILTLALVSYVLLSQVVISWLGKERGETEGPLVSSLLTVALALSIGLVTYLAQTGRAIMAPGGGPASNGDREDYRRRPETRI